MIFDRHRSDRLTLAEIDTYIQNCKEMVKQKDKAFEDGDKRLHEQLSETLHIMVEVLKRLNERLL